MDGRGSRRLGLFLLFAVGCQHSVVTVPNMGTLTTANAPQTPSDIAVTKAPPKPAKDLPPPVLVSSGDFKSGEALTADIPPAQRQQIWEMARQDYEKALKLDPKYVPAYQGLARLYTSMQDPRRAVETYQKALQIAPNNAAVWYELGMCHNYQKNYAPAVDCLSRAAQFDPGNHSYQNTLGVVLAQAGRYDDSLQCFIRTSGEAMGNYRLAQTLQRLQRPELSQRYLAVALHKDPNLAASLAMQSGMSQANPPIQRTSYPEGPTPTANLPANAPPNP
jgi:Tfp pilus assembly protein PilF